ncbi:MAG: hypothetical protein IPF93_13125 [Saprospiraceae bacterium]|nr:hypothetical protein [Saprospiraceae bacterium]
MEDDKIVKGFNSGYEIAQQDMNLAKTMAESYQGEKTDYTIAFVKGIEEYQLEEKSMNPKIEEKSNDELEIH